jgi:acyl-CoA thioesterase FadM
LPHYQGWVKQCSSFDLDPVRGRRLLQAGHHQEIWPGRHSHGGYPAKFHIASTHGDWITIESRVESFKRSSFEVTHKVFKGEALAIEAFETRVLVGRHPDDPARLKSAAVPEEIVAKFMRG